MKRETNDVTLNNVFQEVRVSTLSENDDIFCYTPKSEEEAEIKENIIKAIKSKIPDFKSQVEQPCLGKDGELCYTAGGTTYGHNIVWWTIKAENVWSERKSRIGSPEQRFAFLGYLIKELHEKYDYTVEEAWDAVCTSTENLKKYNGVWKDLDSIQITLKGVSDAILFGGSGRPIASFGEAGWWTAFEGFSMARAWIVCDCDEE